MTTDLPFYLRCLTISLTTLAAGYKFYIYYQVRKKAKLAVRFRLFTFYTEEQIESTTSAKKRIYMSRANYATILMYAFILPILLWIIFNAFQLIEEFVG